VVPANDADPLVISPPVAVAGARIIEGLTAPPGGLDELDPRSSFSGNPAASP